MMKPPVRWKDSDEIDSLARELFSSARATRAIPETSRMRGARRVARLASAPIVGLGVGLLSKAAAAGFALGAASAVAVVAGVPSVRARLLAPTELVSRPEGPSSAARGPAPSACSAAPAAMEPDPSPPAEPAASKHVEAPVGSRATTKLPVSSTAARPSAEVRAALPDDPPPAPPPADSAAPPTGADQAMSAEVALLLEARRQADTDPISALATLERHARSFPGGSLAMERDVLIVEALARSGRRPEAVRRAWEILERAPNAFYTARLKHLIEHDPAR